MAYDINWFENNMVAIPGGLFGNCSACCLRNMGKFCEKIQCFDKANSLSVYWWTKTPGHGREILMGVPSKDMIEWFRKTTVEQAQEITGNMINKALQNHKQHVK